VFTQSRELVSGGRSVPGEVLVKFKRPPTANERAALHSQIDADSDETVGGLGVVRFHSRTFDVGTLINFFSAHPNAEYVEPNFIVHSGATPSDPLFLQLWGLQNSSVTGADIGAVPAWDVSTGSRTNVVAVIDTGIDYTHQDLAANVWTAPSAFTVTIGGSTITCAAGTHGFNAIQMTCDPMDDNNHGTHVSGTIGAVGNNAAGISGINWTASVMGAKFLNSSGSGSIADAINAIEFTIQAKQAFAATAAANVRVLSNSWGSTGYSSSLLNEINRAASYNMLFVAAAGNAASNNDTTPFYPASYAASNVVSVAATDSNDFLASFSNYGANSVHLGAPGVGIVSTTIGNTYSSFSGTSMATPHVSGAAALVLSHCALDTAGLKSVLLNAVDHLGSLTGLTTTGGRLNVNTAIRSCTSSPAPGPVTAPAAPTGLVSSSGNAAVSLNWNASSGAATYNVKRGSQSGGETTIASNVTTPNYTDNSVSNGSIYYYVVSAVNSGGESANSTETVAAPTAPAPVVPPSAPASLTAVTGPGAKKITLNWSAAGGASSYVVSRSTKTGGPYAVLATGVTSTSYQNSGLASGATYYYVISASNSGGTSGYSTEASAKAR